MSLTKEQQKAFEIFLSGKSFCVTGPAGCGKSFLIKHIKKYCEQNKQDIGITALTGAAATIINGQTLHGWGGLGLAKPCSKVIATNIILKNFPARKRWKTVKTLIIDEISMMSAELFTKIESVARIVRKNKSFMGGIQLILSGDFLQLEPIGSDRLCFESKVWKENIQNNCIYLKDIIRQSDPEFQTLLSEIRVGKVTDKTKEILEGRIIDDKEEASIIIEGEDEKILPTVLYPYKKNVERENMLEYSKLVSEGVENHQYLSNDHVINKKTKFNLPCGAREIETLNKTCRASDSLELCIGAQVMLIWNVDFLSGLVNGSRGVITKFEGDRPVVVFDNGVEYKVEKIEFEVDIGKEILVRKQYPLMLAWALTVHKCQGATLTHVITNLAHVFCNSQTYVTLSRVKSLDGLYLLAIDFKKIKVNKKVIKFYENLEGY